MKMSPLKTIGVAVAAVLVLGATFVATAFGADALFLKSGTNNAFTVKGGAGNLTTLSNFFGINCTGATGSGTFAGNDKDTFTATINYTGCTELGAATKSLGAKAGEIVQPSEGELCIISTSPLTVGVWVKATSAVHIEGLALQVISGEEIGTVTSALNTDLTKGTISFQKNGNGDPKIASCTGLVARSSNIKVIEGESGETMGAIENTSIEIIPAELVTIDG